jgi:hypothetical protein
MATVRTTTIGAKMPKNTWSDATQWAIYTKNRMLHKPIVEAPIKLLLKRDPATGRKNLRNYGEWVWCMIIQLQESLNLEQSKHVSLTILIHIMYIGQLMHTERRDYLTSSTSTK